MSFLNDWLLSLILVVPGAGAAAVLIVRRPAAVRRIALAATLTTVLLALLVLVPFHWHRSGPYGYDPGGTVQLSARAEWFQSIRAGYMVAVDGLSIPFLILATIICCIACIASWTVQRRPAQYFALVLLFEASVLGMLLGFDLLMVTVCSGLTVVPAYLLVRGWGRPESPRAAARLLAYLGGAFISLLVAAVGVHHLSIRGLPAATFDLVVLSASSSDHAGGLLFGLILIGFLGRLGILPLHGWIRSIMSEASPAVAMLLLGLIPLSGGYGLFRVALPLFPQAVRALWPASAWFGIGVTLVAGLRATGTGNAVRAAVYGSVSSAGLVLLGASTMTPVGANGAVYLLLGQATITSLLALLNGYVLDRSLGRGEKALGLAAAAPAFTGFFSVGWFARLVTPGLLGTIMIVVAVFQAGRPDSVLHPTARAGAGVTAFIAMTAALGIPIAAFDVIAGIRRQFAGAQPAGRVFADVESVEAAALTPLAVLLVTLGIFPTATVFAFTTHALEAIHRLGR